MLTSLKSQVYKQEPAISYLKPHSSWKLKDFINYLSCTEHVYTTHTHTHTYKSL